MSELLTVAKILGQALQLGTRADSLTMNSPLLGAVPEFDSMAVVAILNAIEEHYGFVVEDDEIFAETFSSVGSLVRFVEQKLGG